MTEPEDEQLSFLLTIALAGTGRDDQDLQRVKLLLRSFRRYFEPGGLARFFVVTTPQDLRLVEDTLGPLLPHGKLQVLDENAICPELASDPDTTTQWPKPNKGWYRQQLIKLAIHERVETPWYMTLDSDVLFVAPFSPGSLIRGGRAALNVQTEADFRRLYRRKLAAHEVKVRESRYARAAHILKFARGPEYLRQWYGETPVLLNRGIVKALTEHIEASWMRPWRQALLDNLPWTEYPLYFLFAENRGLLPKHHAPGDADTVLRLSRSLWQPSDQYLVPRDLSNWNPESIFDSGEEGIAVVVQSYLGYPVAEIAKRIDPFLTGGS